MDGHDDDQSQSPAPTGYQLSSDIMVAAIIVLFVVVFIMVLLHVYAQCYVHHRRRRRENSNLVFHVNPTNPATAGLDSTILKTLPVFTFSDDQKLPECAVCLSEFAGGEKGRLLPKCGHTFHVDCIDMWFHSHSTCPLCRTLVDGDFPSPAGDVSEPTQSEPTHPELPTSSNLSGRRKRVDLAGVSVEIPARVASSGFPNSDELGSGSPAGQVLKSPASRLVSLKRILSRGKKPIFSPTSAGTSCAEMAGMEEGRAESRSRASTPR